MGERVTDTSPVMTRPEFFNSVVIPRSGAIATSRAPPGLYRRVVGLVWLWRRAVATTGLVRWTRKPPKGRTPREEPALRQRNREEAMPGSLGGRKPGKFEAEPAPAARILGRPVLPEIIRIIWG
jgi:hypothetical protein